MVGNFISKITTSTGREMTAFFGSIEMAISMDHQDQADSVSSVAASLGQPTSYRG
jgi:hypothetical protein